MKSETPCKACENYQLTKSNKRCRLTCKCIKQYLDDLEKDSLMKSCSCGLTYKFMIPD